MKITFLAWLMQTYKYKDISSEDLISMINGMSTFTLLRDFEDYQVSGQILISNELFKEKVDEV